MGVLQGCGGMVRVKRLTEPGMDSGQSRALSVVGTGEERILKPKVRTLFFTLIQGLWPCQVVGCLLVAML